MNATVAVVAISLRCLSKASLERIGAIMSDPPSVHHIAVLVRDLDLCEAFYCGVLGLPVLERWTDAEGAPRSVWLSLGGGAFLAVERAPAGALARPASSSGWHCIALGIAPDGREPWRCRLAAAGVPIERESPHSLYVRDPEGNLVALSHWPHAAP